MPCFMRLRTAAHLHHQQHAGHRKASDQRRDPQGLAREHIRNEAGAEQLKLGRERPDRLALQHRQRQPLEHQHAGQRDDERRDLVERDPIPLRRADGPAQHQAQKAGEQEVHVVLDHQHRRHRADEAAHRTHRQVDVAGHDHQQHAQRHDDDVAVLQDQIGQVQRLEQRAVGHHLEKHHDRDQRDQHAVFAQVVLQHARRFFGVGLLCIGGRGGCGGGHVNGFLVSCAHDGFHDLLLRRFGDRELGHERALVQHADAVAHAQQLGHLRRDHQHALCLRRRAWR